MTSTPKYNGAFTLAQGREAVELLWGNLKERLIAAGVKEADRDTIRATFMLTDGNKTMQLCVKRLNAVVVAEEFDMDHIPSPTAIQELAVDAMDVLGV